MNTYLTDVSKSYQRGVASLVRYVKDQKQCSGKEGKILYLDSQCANYVTDVTVPPGKLLILLIIQ